jgi:parallel beta-helix repeat protein
MCIEVFSTRNKLSEEYTYGCAGEGRTLFMEKKTASAILLTLLLISMLTLAFKIQPAKAEGGTIYIRADGSIDPPTAPISTVDNVTYIFTDNIYDEIVVERNNMIIDGNGYTLQGPGSGTGISLSGIENVTIKNTIIKNYNYGIWLWPSSNNNVISGNNITNSQYGMSIMGSENNSISGNNITNNYDGIALDSSSGNTVSGNNVTANNSYGIELFASLYNVIYHNNFIGNVVQVYVSNAGYFNTWDDGYPSGGNYWSDYKGTDLNGGPYQNVTGSDGIGDTRVVFLYENNTDHYPLMNPYGAPPPPTYTLTITTTVGGTTDPAPGTYSYTANSTVQVTAIPNVNYLFEYWELDGINVDSANPYSVYMDKDHTLKAVFSPVQPPLSVSASPLSASILVGQSVTFTSTVSGGYTPYSYQWYLNGPPVSGANATSWKFTPTTSGIYYVYLKVTDAKGNTTQSQTARITAATVPVGGYSIPIQVQTKAEPVLPYIALIATLTAIFTKMKPKTKRKH